MGSFDRRRPNFDKFRHWFIEEVNRHVAQKIDNPLVPWLEVGDREKREAIIESFMHFLESNFGFRPVINTKLSTMEGPLESVVIRIFHTFSTMLLVEHINQKVLEEREKKLH